MLLHSLNDYFSAHTDALPPLGWVDKPVDAVLSIDCGRLAITDLRPAKGEEPVTLRVPAGPEGRTSAIKAGTIVDNAAYVLGARKATTDNKKKGIKKGDVLPFPDYNTAYVERLKSLEHPALAPILDAYASGAVAKLADKLTAEQSDLLTAQTIVWEVDAAYAHDAAADAVNACVDGTAIARLHPGVKGVRGGKPNGAVLVGYNFDACTSWGREQGQNGEMTVADAHAYTTALTHLVRTQSWQRSGMVVTWWSDGDAAEPDLDLLLMGGEGREEIIGQMLHSPRTGGWIEGDDTPAHVAILQLADARLSVLDYRRTTVAEIGRHVREWWRDLRSDSYPTLAALLMSGMVNPDFKVLDKVPGAVWVSLWRMALFGVGSVPGTLVTDVLARAINRGMTDNRIALLRLAVTRNYGSNDMVNTAYRLGQYAAVVRGLAYKVNHNSTAVDAILKAMARNPASALPRLDEKVQTYLGQMTRMKQGGLAHWYRQHLAELLDGIDEVPAAWTTAQRVQWVLGRADAERKKEAPDADDATEDDAA